MVEKRKTLILELAGFDYCDVPTLVFFIPDSIENIEAAAGWLGDILKSEKVEKCINDHLGEFAPGSRLAGVDFVPFGIEYTYQSGGNLHFSANFGFSFDWEAAQ